MKYIRIFLLMLALFGASATMFYACTKQDETLSSTIKKTTKDNHREMSGDWIKFRVAIRWPGIDHDHDGITCECPGCKICPLLVCVSFGARLDSEPLTQAETDIDADGDLGYIFAKVVNGKVRMDFDQPTCIIEPSLDPSGQKIYYQYQDWQLPSNIAAALGYTSVTLKQGVYHPDFSSNPFGVVDVDAILVP